MESIWPSAGRWVTPDRPKRASESVFDSGSLLMRMGGCVAAYGLAAVIPGDREERMYRIWYWAMIDRESDGRFIASIRTLKASPRMATPTRKRLLNAPS